MDGLSPASGADAGTLDRPTDNDPDVPFNDVLQGVLDEHADRTVPTLAPSGVAPARSAPQAASSMPQWLFALRQLVGRASPIGIGAAVLFGEHVDPYEPPQAATVAGHPEIGAAVNRANGQLSGFVGLHIPGSNGAADRDIALTMDAQGNLTARPGEPGDGAGILGRASPDGTITLTQAGMAALGLTSPGAEPSALAGGAGAPPNAGAPGNTAGCEEPAKGEPGRSAGQKALPQRSPVPDALRGDSPAARKIVTDNDPAIAAAGLKPSDWVAHHLVTREAAGSDAFSALFDAAAAGGWREDSAGNVVGLPTNCPAQEALARVGAKRPEHVGSHPTWNGDVSKLLSDGLAKLRGSSLQRGSDAYNAEARRIMEGIEDNLRSRLPNMERVTQLQTPSVDVPA